MKYQSSVTRDAESRGTEFGASSIDRIADRGRSRDGLVFRAVALVLCTIGVLTTSGCTTLRERFARNDEDEFDRLASADDVQGPMQRLLGRIQGQQISNQAIAFSPEAQKELDNANRLAEKGDTRNAAKQYKRITKDYSGTATGEEAQFRLGELYFAQKQHAKAQDAFDQLFQDYPSSRYTDQATKRLFTIAGNWLDFPNIATPGDIKQASFNSDGSVSGTPPPSPPKPRDITKRVPVLPNFHDRSRPVFDTRGRGLQALRSIWLNDPTGPLADDALMLTASYYLRKGDYVESDRYYQILREEYPKSPHLENAFVLGSHVKLMSYQGSQYEGNTLADARKLKESTLRLFPDNENRERIRKELSRIHEAEAQRDWSTVEIYMRKGRPRAVAVYCQQIIENYPTSSYAQRARRVLSSINPRHLNGLPGFDTPGRPDTTPRPYEESVPPSTRDDNDDTYENGSSDAAESDVAEEPRPPRRFRLFRGRS